MLTDLDEKTAALELLRRFAPPGRLDPADGCPDWLRAAAELARSDAGVLTLVGPTILGVPGSDHTRVRPQVDQSALIVAGIAGGSRATSEKVAIGLPPGGRYLPLLLALDVILGDLVERAFSDDERRRTTGRAGVLIISPDIDLRSKYCDIYLDDVSLDSDYPGYRVQPDGQLARVLPGNGRADSGGGARGICFFLAPHRVLPETLPFKPRYVIIDARYGHWAGRTAEVVGWAAARADESGCPLMGLYSLGDADAASAFRGARFADVPFDHMAAVEAAAALADDPDGIADGIDWSLNSIATYLDRSHAVVEVQAPPDLEAMFRGVREQLELLPRDGRRFQDVRAARWLLATLSQLPVPVAHYEAQARAGGGTSSLRSLIQRLGRMDPGLEHAEVAALIPALRAQLDDLYSRLHECNPKAEVLGRLLREDSPPAGEGILIAVRNQVTARAVRSWLRQEDVTAPEAPGRIDVRCFADLEPARRYDRAVTPGPWQARRRWQLGGPVAASIQFLVYEFERDPIQAQLWRLYGDAPALQRSEQRAWAFAHIARRPLKSEKPPVAQLRLRLPAPERGGSRAERRGEEDSRLEDWNEEDTGAGSKDEPLAVPVVRLREPRSDAEDWDEDEPDDDALDRAEAGAMSSEPVACLEVQVRSSRLGRRAVLALPLGGTSDVFDRDSNVVTKRPNRELADGQVLLRIDEAGRTSVYDRLLEVARAQDGYAELEKRRRQWQEVLAAATVAFTDRDGRVSYGRFLAALRGCGSDIRSPVAVKKWVTGETIGPDSQASLQAVGRLSGSHDLQAEFAEVDAALWSIRALHQAIGRRVSQAMSGAVARAGTPLEAMDDSLQARVIVPMDELLAAVDYCEILSLMPLPEPLPAYQVGRLTPIGGASA